MFRSLPLLLAALVSGCSVAEESRPSPPANKSNEALPVRQEEPSPVHATPLRIATYAPKGPSMLALMKGILAEQNGCLVLKADGGIVLPVFRRSSISSDVSGISYGERTYQLGDEIELGGGAMPQSGLPPAELDLAGCTAERIFLVG